MKSIKCVFLLCAASLISACDIPAAKQAPGEATVQENAPMPKVGTYYVDMAALEPIPLGDVHRCSQFGTDSAQQRGRRGRP